MDGPIIWKFTWWESTKEKSLSNVISAAMLVLLVVLCGSIWEAHWGETFEVQPMQQGLRPGVIYRIYTESDSESSTRQNFFRSFFVIDMTLGEGNVDQNCKKHTNLENRWYRHITWARHDICPKFYTARFSGYKFYTTKVRNLWRFSRKWTV